MSNEANGGIIEPQGNIPIVGEPVPAFLCLPPGSRVLPDGTWQPDYLRLIDVAYMHSLSWSEVQKLMVCQLREMMERQG